MKKYMNLFPKAKTMPTKYTGFEAAFSANSDIIVASFRLSDCIAQHGRPFSCGDFLITGFLTTSNSLSEYFPITYQIIKRITKLTGSINAVKQ
jgi:hypothetical protein